MLAIYLFCLVLGGGFLLVSLLGAGDGGELDMDVDVDVDVDVDAGGDTDTAAAKIFSFRTLVYALFGFGATGSALTALGYGSLFTAGLAVVGGLLSGALVGALFNYLGRTSSGAAPSDADLIGLTGRVTLPLSRDVPGTVVVEQGGRRISLRALPHGSEGDDPESWVAVVVVEVDKGLVRVSPLTASETDLLPSGPDDA